MKAILLAVLLAIPAHALAQVVDRRPPSFESELEEKRFRSLVDELRCVMCQNQSLADSDAQIAIDLRREILQLIRDGRSDAEIREFLVARYGDFVLYRPEVGPATWLLWFGPLLLLGIGGIVVWRVASGRAAAPPSGGDDPGDW